VIFPALPISTHSSPAGKVPLFERELVLAERGLRFGELLEQALDFEKG
jgi:hypothetical protein